ncbi:tyrosine-protein phosphatase non-receptor type substrate 1-like isoform X2 [Hemitrygon akajei]|uniref:tyrosine-protein phosphatase non-receptor type substrate 1-like isoform X2 n=1 Tax=Hemitrygon akajei TaxID=2704970 RepID=UPI003BF9CA3E
MSEKFTVTFMALLAITWLTVKVTPSEVAQFPKDLDVPRGANVTMFCKFPLSQDVVTVRWWREGEKSFLERNNRREFTVERGRGTLVLWNVKVPDSGMYYCEAKHQQQSFRSGSGTKLTVFASPTPLEIVPIGEFSSPRKLLCKTAAFYPKKLEFVWQKNNQQIRTGIETVINQTAEGLHMAYSSLEINLSASGKDVYICLVSHASLTVPTAFSYILEQGADTRLILACAVGGSAILVLIIVLLILKLKRSHECSSRRMETRTLQNNMRNF